jgi:hypothetical protein
VQARHLLDRGQIGGQRRERAVGGQHRTLAEEVGEQVGRRREAERAAIAVEGGAQRRVEAGAQQSPGGAVRPARPAERQEGRRVLRRGQDRRAVGDVAVGEAGQLGRRARRGLHARADHQLGAAHRVGQGGELRLQDPAPVVLHLAQHAERAAVHHVRLAGQVLAHRAADRAVLEAVRARLVGEVGRATQDGVVALGAQRHAEPEQGVDVAPRPLGGQRDAHRERLRAARRRRRAAGPCRNPIERARPGLERPPACTQIPATARGGPA